MELYLVRHAQSKAQTNEDFSDDPMLTEKGQLQAELLGKRLKDIKFARIISSGLTRAFQTAVAVASEQNNKIPIEIYPEFSECGINPLWKPNTELHKSLYDNVIYHSLFLEKNYTNDKERAKDALEKAVFPFAYSNYNEYRECNEGLYENNSGKILVAAHGMFNAYLIGLLVNFPFDVNTVIEQRNTCINRFNLFSMNNIHRVRFSAFNDTAHLTEDIDTWKSIRNPEP